MQIRNPRNGQYDYELQVDTVDTIREKTSTIRAAQREWLGQGIDYRIKILQQLASSMEANKEALFDQLSIDTGRRTISSIELESAIGLIRGRCISVKHLLKNQDIRPSVTNPTVHIKQERVPYDVIGVISPWNFPLLLALIDAIPALLAGSTVLLKPSEVTPRFLDPLEDCIKSIPELQNVLALIRGGADAGKAVVDNVDAICFTGSVATGKKIGARCAERFIPAFLELGGKDPAIVLEDADLDIATDAILRSCAGATGQACQSLERIYVHENVYEAFLNLIVEKASAVTDNSDYDIGGLSGPLIFENQAEKIRAQLEDAIKKGAQIRTGGEIKNINGGLWLLPTVVTDVTHDMALMTDETFGPVIPIMTFSDVEQGIELANDSNFGLSASVFGSEDAACHRRDQHQRC